MKYDQTLSSKVKNEPINQVYKMIKCTQSFKQKRERDLEIGFKQQFINEDQMS